MNTFEADNGYMVFVNFTESPEDGQGAGYNRKATYVAESRIALAALVSSLMYKYSKWKVLDVKHTYK